ncbi:MAG: hypothetical protein B6244_10830 [Candidatus Cloacimonetes bacterium 4572_55]|nr:MAG: hypothetical protein B6244_10830 [Candidatus Cloacimonetes bacterium 4572_55]
MKSRTPNSKKEDSSQQIRSVLTFFTQLKLNNLALVIKLFLEESEVNLFRNLVIIISVLIFVPFAVQAETTQRLDAHGQPIPASTRQPEFVAGEIIIKFSEGVLNKGELSGEVPIFSCLGSGKIGLRLQTRRAAYAIVSV